MGTNFSGIIESVGEAVSQYHIGDEAIGIPTNTGDSGSWATYRSIDQKDILLKPTELSHQVAVSMIIAGCVAYDMILSSKVKKGDKCLVVGASGGIGSVVTQILKAKGAIVTGLCSTRNIIAVKANGADDTIDYTKENFSEVLAARGVKMDLVFDSVGGKEIEKKSVNVLHKKGKFVTVCGPEKYIGSKKMSWGEVISMLAYILKRSIFSKWVGPSYIFSGTTPSTTINEMLEFVIQHNIKVPFDRVISLQIDEFKDALRHLGNRKTGCYTIMNAGFQVIVSVRNLEKRWKKHLKKSG
ncbi:MULTISPECIES: NAD(P)-dependent alcohol dehydrogenase [unclassified Lentimicrobium]|uniref:NAD(P)-dependent alcohol dehydrogenase n=1 Tax=unclassified Lentimicrobium TaxID=2677434 RepID=UPI0015521FA4|nr:MULTISPECIES: NAD(P)-dependent alcohol dehydrogenase [unclassified Lentimicrobium]NPD46134.1 NAD(P)-dependent alcohol dehydrogenase [Lentimicrobium sp. S6]NPD86484.1 NAD(P)-dependent alcohol dehydrogenase [Lentimicrobium sp. L6]